MSSFRGNGMLLTKPQLNITCQMHLIRVRLYTEYPKQVVKNEFLKKPALLNRVDMSIFKIIHCKLQSVNLWTIVKEDSGLRTMFDFVFEISSIRSGLKTSKCMF